MSDEEASTLRNLIRVLCQSRFNPLPWAHTRNLQQTTLKTFRKEYGNSLIQQLLNEVETCSGVRKCLYVGKGLTQFAWSYRLEIQIGQNWLQNIIDNGEIAHFKQFSFFTFFLKYLLHIAQLLQNIPIHFIFTFF